MIALVLFAAGLVALLVPPKAVRPVVHGGAAAVTGGALAAVLCPVPAVVVVAAALAAAGPAWLTRRRATAARLRARSQWPEAIDAIRAAVRAGATVAEAVAEPGSRWGGAQSGELAQRFAAYRRRLASGELFDTAVTALQDRGDPVAERVVAVLRLAADVGSADVGRVLAALSSFVRADLAQDREIAARQQWNVAAARVAVAAPWLTVAVLSAQADARAAYTSTAGAVLLALVAALSVAAYALMMRAARVTS